VSALDRYSIDELIQYHNELVHPKILISPLKRRPQTKREGVLHAIRELERLGAHNRYILPEDPVDVGIV
jgi:hypothetical protein